MISDRDGAGTGGLADRCARCAEICLVDDAVLATRNVKDFAGTGVDLVDLWSTPG